MTNPIAPEHPSTPPQGTVVLLTGDHRLADGLAPALAAVGLALAVVSTPSQLRQRLPPQAPGDLGGPAVRLVLIDLRAWPKAEGALFPDDHEGVPPLVLLGSSQDLPQRLSAAPRGCLAWLAPDLPPTDLAARLRDLAPGPEAAPERVLVVEDQPVAALFAKRVLEQAGMITDWVAEPLGFLAALERFVPDLVLMDLHMPGASGLELTRVIREQDRFADLPIIFLSAELDPGRQLEALRVGGNDFLAKPVPPEQLVACVRQRLARTRQRARRPGAGAARLPAGGLVEQEHLMERLDQLIRDQAGRSWVLVHVALSGDEAALSRCARAAAARAGSRALTARIGAEAVAVLLRAEDPRAFAAVVDALGQDLRADLGSPALGLGWCAVTDGGGEAVTLLSRACKAAGLSSSRGLGRVVGYRESPTPEAVAAPQPGLASVLGGERELLFQPIVPLRGAASPRYEAMPRLRLTDSELIGPRGFARSGLLARELPGLDRWLLATGLDALRRSRDAGRPAQVFLHQSLGSVADETWVAGVREAISSRDLIACRPVIQLQAEEVAGALELTQARAGQLARLGIVLCLNGFGAGGSPEALLERVPAAFVRLAPGLSDARRLELVRLAHAHRARVIVTGVEGPEAITVLYVAGVDLIQGPYIQPPGPAMNFEFAEVVGEEVEAQAPGA